MVRCWLCVPIVRLNGQGRTGAEPDLYGADGGDDAFDRSEMF